MKSKNGSYTEKPVFVFPFTFLLLKTGLKKLLIKTAILHEHKLFVEKKQIQKIYKSFIGFPNETVKEINEIRIWIS